MSRTLADLVLSALICCALLVAACGSTNGSDKGGNDGSSGSSTKPTTKATTGDAGSHEPTTNNHVHLGPGGALAPPVGGDRLTAQGAANAIHDAGLKYDDGTVHDPSYVSCKGGEVSAESPDTSTELDCRVEVPDVAPYNIHVTVDKQTSPRFTFEGYAK